MACPVLSAIRSSIASCMSAPPSTQPPPWRCRYTPRGCAGAITRKEIWVPSLPVMVMVRARSENTGGGERTVTPPLRCPLRLRTNDPSFRLTGQQLNHLRVQVRSVGVDRRIVEHDGIERAYVCHRL